jgi:hypothetical protein
LVNSNCTRVVHNAVEKASIGKMCATEHKSGGSLAK